MELLRELVPKATVIAFISNPNNPYADSEVRRVQDAARSFGWQLQVMRAATTQEIDTAFATLVQLRPGALIVGSDPFFNARRDRLFRRYLLLILSLVTIALLASGAISVIFSYQENKSALASVQHEKAVAAASRIEQYVEQIVKQLTYAALQQLEEGDIEARRNAFRNLLSQVPEVTDIAPLDAAGREQIAVSRLDTDKINSGKDRSKEPAFPNAKRGQPWFSPVYFRKE